ncbi:MAG TPA: cytochrome P450 [Candidatus Binatia bacterium]|nr:cytochrome P450 [Candidatus Binatia bacterium]
MEGSGNVAEKVAERVGRDALPPGPPLSAMPVVLAAMRTDPLRFLVSLTRRYGDVIRLRFVLWNVYLVWRPEHVKHVLQDRHAIYTKGKPDYQVLKRILGEGLVTSDGDHWLRQRRLMQPAFHRTSIAAFAALIVERTRVLLESWEEPARRGTSVDIYHQMRRLSLDVVTRALFGVKLHEDARAVGEAFAVLSEELADHLYSPFFFFFLLPALPTPGNRRARRALRTLDEIVGSIIARRRADVSDADDDLLALLLRARDDDGGGEGMTDRQIRDEVMTLLLAGHETTAMALSWTWFLLDRHPAIAARVRREVLEALGDRDATVEDLPRLAYVTRVLEEAMRLYPPAWMFTRTAREPDEIGGYAVPPKTIVMVSPYVTHRAPAVWDEPERFDPDRFTPERSAGRPRFAYFPFAGGPRQCIGSEFALTEATLVVATIAQRWRLELATGRPVVPRPSITLRPRRGLPMIPRPHAAA